MAGAAGTGWAALSVTVVAERVWRTSKHVQHFRLHAEEYRGAVRRFLAEAKYR